MLVLSRKLNEKILIGGDITIQVVKVSRNRVRIATDAPDGVRITRGASIEQAPTTGTTGSFGAASGNVAVMERPATTSTQSDGLGLVLSRKEGERILIGDEIALTIVDIRGDKVRIGVEAPRDVTVHRAEVDAAIKLERDAELQPPALEQ